MDLLGIAVGVPILGGAAAGDPSPGGSEDALLLESGDGLLLESGDFLLLE